ncbi:DUF4827 domain-containing protein [Dysgonomonas sp. HGC4]|uniref:DUF4827 domain-containing protein n=1 Tax=Dysgonomonas sp. HGC4 TaxID=1658009 RepID=UPI0006825B69|nr:DUF4827 domain-containing protein [Dysgonomonas sp. HGC4]MBD8349799.1 DUF4827 family protein [Dysgonomonas sp. HGC4]
MKKVLGLVCFVIGLCIAFGACSSTETYADKLKKERKNIARFINENNITVRSDYPASGVFAENEFFRDPATGVYIHVIDSGNGVRANAAKRSVINVRCNDALLLPSDTVAGNNIAGFQPIQFTYGIVATYTGVNSANMHDYVLLSAGIVAPLKFVGENARVSLIVPFAQGSTYQGSSFQALYYPMLHYTRIINN